MTENLRTIEQFDKAGEPITEEQVKQNVRVSDDLVEHIEWLRDVLALGFEKIFLHNVNQKQEQFINAFGEHVLSKFT